MVRIGARSGRVYEANFPVEDIHECYEEVSDADEQRYSADKEAYKYFVRGLKHRCQRCYYTHDKHCGIDIPGNRFDRLAKERHT